LIMLANQKNTVKLIQTIKKDNIFTEKMTKPKQKPCPHCQALNNISCKTCKACFASLPLRKRVKNIQKHIEESAWMSNTKKHRNAARVVDSARIAVKKLEVLGYKPVLFISKEKKNGFVAEVITSMGPFAVGPLQTIFERMTSLYEFFIKRFKATPVLLKLFASTRLPPFLQHPPRLTLFLLHLPPPPAFLQLLPHLTLFLLLHLPPPPAFFLLPPPSTLCLLLHCLPPPSFTFYTLPPPPSSSSSSLTPPTSSYITLLSPTSSSCTLPPPPTSFPTPPPTPFSSTLTPTSHCINPPPPFNFSNLSPTNPSFPCQNTHAAPINTGDFFHLRKKLQNCHALAP
uniref:Uncharacterized protein n=1 Tax=Cyprinus carpio TaxID=7962 RepID=A0A8C1X378_CYPCA